MTSVPGMIEPPLSNLASPRENGAFASIFVTNNGSSSRLIISARRPSHVMIGSVARRSRRPLRYHPAAAPAGPDKADQMASRVLRFGIGDSFHEALSRVESAAQAAHLGVGGAA